MPRSASSSSSTRKQIHQLLSQFTDKITAVLERAAPKTNGGGMDDVRARVMAALGLAKRGPGRPKGSGNKAKGVAAPRKRKPQTAAQKKANVLQGQYLGNIRLLSAADKAKVKAARVKSGVRAAIKMAVGFKNAA